jgi:pyridoxal phosphate enzyme (YggS family)
MEPSAERILSNLRDVKDRMAAAAARSGRAAGVVRLVAVTKSAEVEAIRVLVEAGQRDVGESRPQQLRDRAAALAGLPVEWHMIGQLQRNKVKYVVPTATLIHGVDSIALAEEISRRAAAQGCRAACLLEINSGEEQKGGVAPTDAVTVATAVAALPALDLVGLMTMAPLSDDPEASRPAFAALRELRDKINRSAFAKAADKPLTELSMGMTQDYEVAIEEGATIVRVGTALFL